jgi:hypothetical protein
MKMVRTIFDRFGNVNIEVNNLNKYLMEAAPEGGSYEQLREYLLRIDGTVRRIGNINGDTDMAMRAVWPRVVCAIPPGTWTEIRALVSEFSKFKQGMPELFYWKKPVMLFEAVKRHILQNHRVFPNMKEAEDAELHFATAAARVQSKSAARVATSNARRSGTERSSRQEKRKPEGNLACFICEDTNHLFHNCPIPTGERIKYAIDHNRCPGCLSKTHGISTCATKRACRKCDINKATDLSMIFHHFSLCPKGLGRPSKKLKREDLSHMVNILREYDLDGSSSSDTDMRGTREED